jgi:hypothetical protein
MRSRFMLAGLLLLLPALPAAAAVPGSITGLFGNDIGFFLAQSDFCGWDMSAKIHSTYDSAFTQIGMTAAQQAQVWQDVATRQKILETLPAPAIARMKSECTPATQARIEKLLGS